MLGLYALSRHGDWLQTGCRFPRGVLVVVSRCAGRASSIDVQSLLSTMLSALAMRQPGVLRGQFTYLRKQGPTTSVGSI